MQYQARPRWPARPGKAGALMFEGLFQPMHLLVILGVALLFGPKKLPELGKGFAVSNRP